jgi:NADH dehydrogenase
MVLQCLEKAALTSDPGEKDALTNFVIVGGGPAGVETAGALAEFKKHILQKDYPDLNLDLMKISLVQSGDRLLKGMSDHASNRALEDLRELGVEVILESRVKRYDGVKVTTDTGLELISRSMIWTAGVMGNLPHGIAENAVAPGRRLKVDLFQRVEGQEDVYALGDVACMVCENYPFGHPMVAQPAIQQGRNLAGNLMRECMGQAPRAFRYKDKGSLATIGRRRAVADVGKWETGGLLAWLLWSFVHVFFLIGFRSKFLVFSSWLVSYFTYEKGNRFIVRRYSGSKRGDELE